MKVLVVGGSGFIGTRLVRGLLDRGHEVLIFDRRPSEIFPQLVQLGDVRDLDALTHVVEGQDCVVNLAAEHADDVSPIGLYAEVNVGGARNVVQALTTHNIQQLLFVSSVAVYGPSEVPVSEHSILAPNHPYGESKKQAEAIYRAWFESEPTTRCLSIVRPCVVFGEGNRGNLFNLIEHIRERRFRVVGSGNNIKATAYVGNLVEFMIEQLQLKCSDRTHAAVRVVNYADAPQLNTRQLVHLIEILLGVEPQSRVWNRRGIPKPLAMLIGRAFDLLSRIDGKRRAISASRVEKFCAESSVDVAQLQALEFVQAIGLEEGLRRAIAFEWPNG